MGIGASIFLLAIGAILAFAVEYEFAGIDIQVIGYILMLAGLIGAIWTTALFSRRRRTYVEEAPPREVVRERDTY
ncbi:MAG: DUF6458 family protein [Egibacteraceae bacterium]